MTRRHGLALVAVLALLAGGCDDGGGRVDGEEGAPAIWNLTATAVAPSASGLRTTYRFEARVDDADANVGGGFCQVRSTAGFAELPLVAVATAPDVREGIVACLFDISALGREVAGDFTVTDRDGHVSNALGFALEPGPGSTGDSPQKGSGPDVRGVAGSLRPIQS